MDSFICPFQLKPLISTSSLPLSFVDTLCRMAKAFGCIGFYYVCTEQSLSTTHGHQARSLGIQMALEFLLPTLKEILLLAFTKR
jgi:hypothetical protein